MNLMRLCFVTSSRSEYDLIRNILLSLERHQSVDLYLLVTGSHLKEEFGLTIQYIKKDKFKNLVEIDILGEGDDRIDMSYSISRGIKSFSSFFHQNIEFLMVLGDRFEVFAASLAARILGIPIIHFSGGDTSEGSLDNEFRHSISLMSELHLVKLEEHKQKLINLGIKDKNIFRIGSLSIDNFNNFQKLKLEEINENFSTNIKRPFAIVSFHSVTNSDNAYDNDVNRFLESLFSIKNLFLVFTASSSDFGGRNFNSIIQSWVKKFPDRSAYVESFGKDAYFSLLSLANLMIGNSSSGLLESGNFRIPAINILPRQKGRLHNKNVINVENKDNELTIAIESALSTEFINNCKKIENIFDAGLDESISNYSVKKILTHMGVDH